MGHTLTLNVPEEVFPALSQVAESSGQTPAEWVLAAVRDRLTVRDDRLRRHFGAVDLGRPTGAENSEIDADLARQYAGETTAGEPPC